MLGDQTSTNTKNGFINWLYELQGYVGADAYSTAWVALVPSLDDPHQPAWLETMNYLRAHQLPDGGWGEPTIYYAHEKTVSTLAAILALDNWTLWDSKQQMFQTRIRKASHALQRYAADLPNEPYAPVGFELLMPRLVNNLGHYRDLFPLEEWEAVVGPRHRLKLEVIQHMDIDLNAPRAWWFSLELLPPERLAQIDDRILNADGSIQTSVAATAAYLRAKRLHGQDSPRAADYLQRVLKIGRGSVPFSYPTENFERIWGVDNFRRVGLHPQDPMIAPVLEALHDSWHWGTPGFSSSDLFDVNDGDDTLLGFGLLSWAGYPVDEAVMFKFWKDDHFCSYPDESDASLSANIHGLEALRLQPNFPNKELAQQVLRWLRAYMGDDVPFHDKWHLSPFYSASHALHATAGLDEFIAGRCLDFILANQRDDGGWGWFGQSTQEETAHCVIALGHIAKQNLLSDFRPLIRASHYLAQYPRTLPLERLWVGKTLFRPAGVVKALLYAAKSIVAQLGIEYMNPED